jgi:hypothetical protein
LVFMLLPAVEEDRKEKAERKEEGSKEAKRT